MTQTKKTEIIVRAVVNAPVDKVWRLWTAPEHVMRWNNASDDWHTPRAENDLRQGGRFLFRMEARDGSFGFDFDGVYDDLRAEELIVYTIEDGRRVKVTFVRDGSMTRVSESFEAEAENSIDAQRGGWQAILDNFKRYAETQ